MAAKIKILPEGLVNKIAAGEVVERPASVVKELIENSIDAGATEIDIEIEQAGSRLIKVTDDGCGMTRDDALLCFERHATSKIKEEADLFAIRTMGFRGEALSSIAAVSSVRLLTAAANSQTGTLIEIEGGRIKSVSDAAAIRGTSIEVGRLFYNTPARLKFLKSPATEFSHILSVVSRQAMAYPDIRFRLTHNRKDVFDLLPSSSRKERVYQLYGGDIADHVIEFSDSKDGIRISGLLSKPGYTRADRTYQDFYINGRCVKNAGLSHALYAGYSDMLMRDRHPVSFIFIELDPALVDVNVHPAKAEVRFRNQPQIHDVLRDVIRNALGAVWQKAPTPEVAYSGLVEVKEAVQDYFRDSAFDPVVRSAWAGPSTAGGEHKPAISLDGSAPSETGRALYADLPIPLCQIHGSFIIAESKEGMVIIDQHAAHERVLFENLQEQYRMENIPVQGLILPIQIDLGHADSGLLTEHLSDLEAFGLIVDDFGGGTFFIKAVPALLAGGDYRRLLMDILDEIKMQGKSGRLKDLRDNILSVMACHPAIKIHRPLERLEMEALIRDLFSCRMPHTCPHGRPTIVRFSIEEIKRMFKRT